MLRQCGIFLITALISFGASAIEIPKASGAALGVTRGKPFSEGFVFINGRYVTPPYVVERWGVGIRINGMPVIASVIDWSEFVKTQDGVKVTKTETPVAAEPEPEPEPEPVEEDLEDDSDSSLDDLFDDDPKPKKPKKTARKTVVRKPRPRKPTTTVSYSFDGDFVPNDASKALLARINKVRTDINASLLHGGFICFGDQYSRVAGDAPTAESILMKLPEIQKKSESEESFIAAVRAAGMVYLTEPLCVDLYRNRRDYLKLQERRENWLRDREWKKLLNGTDGTSSF